MRYTANNQTIKLSTHAKERMDQSNIKVGYLLHEMSHIPKINGKLRWMTSKGVFMFEQTSENTIVVKTFIAKYKYKGQKYNKGCSTF